MDASAEFKIKLSPERVQMRLQLHFPARVRGSWPLRGVAADGN